MCYPCAGDDDQHAVRRGGVGRERICPLSGDREGDDGPGDGASPGTAGR